MGLPLQRQCRVLLVDDHADTRDLLARLLSRRYEVITAECYDSALACAANTTPDIVVSDVGLPGRDGLALMRELRRRFGIPGIAVTGYPLESDAVFRDAGFVKWLRKPIQFDELLAALAASHPPGRCGEASHSRDTARSAT